MSPRWRIDFQLFAIVCVSVISTQIVTGDINYNDVRHDELSAVRPDQARTSRQILEKILEQTAYKNIYSLQDATEHLLHYGALLRIHVLDTFGALVYDYYDDFSIAQTEALYTVYEDTLQRKYNIFDIVPSILEKQDTRPTTICQYIHEYVSTCLRESSFLCGTIKNHNRPNPEASAIKLANITHHVFQKGNIIDYYPLGFSTKDVLQHLKGGRLNVTAGLLAGLLENVQYDTFDNEVSRAERNVVAVLVEEQSSRSVESQGKVKVNEEEIHKAQDISELLKQILNLNKIEHGQNTSRDFALLAEHVVREVEAISPNIEVFGIVYDNGTIDVDYLFDLILAADLVDGDVTAAKNYLLREMKDHEILEKYLKIDKYVQGGPDDLLMEILEQLKDIHFAEDLATALRAHARFWHRSHMISDLSELLELFEAYENLRRVPRYSDMIRSMDEVRSELSKSKNVSVEILCNNPRACLRLGLEIVSKCAYVLPKTRESLENFFQYLSRDGSVRVDNCGPANETTTCYCRDEPADDSMSRISTPNYESSNDDASVVTEKPQTTLTTVSDDLGNRRTISREPTTRSFRGNEPIDEMLTREPVTLILSNIPDEISQESDEATTLSSTEDDSGKSSIDTKSKGRGRKKPSSTTTTESSTEEMSGDEFPDESDHAMMGTLKSRKLSVTTSEGEEVTATDTTSTTESGTTESTTEDRTTSEHVHLVRSKQGSTIMAEESTTSSSRYDSTSTTEVSTTEEPEITETVALLRSATISIAKLPTNDQTATVDVNLSGSDNDNLSTTEVIATEQRDTTEKLYPSGRVRELASTIIESTTVLWTTTEKQNLPGSQTDSWNSTEPLPTEERATTTEQPRTPSGGNDELTREHRLTTENAVGTSNGEGSTSDSITESTRAPTQQNDLSTDATDLGSTTGEVEVTTEKVNRWTGGKLLNSGIKFEVPRGNKATTGKLLGRVKVDKALTRKSTPLIAQEQTTEMPLRESNPKIASNVNSKSSENCSNTECNSTKCADGKCSSDNGNVDFSECSDRLCARSSVECKDDVNCSDDSVEDLAIACVGKNCTVANSSSLRLPNNANDTLCVDKNCDESGKTAERVVPCNIKDPHLRRKLNRLEKVRVISSLHSADRAHDHAVKAGPSPSTQFSDKHHNEAKAQVSTSNGPATSNKKPVPPKAENLKGKNVKAEKHLGVKDKSLHSAAAIASAIRRHPTLIQEPLYVNEGEGPLNIPLSPDPDDLLRRIEHEYRQKDSDASVNQAFPMGGLYVASRKAMGRSPTGKAAKDVHRRKMSADKSSAPSRVRTTAAWKNQGQNSHTESLPNPKNGTVHPAPKKTIIYENYDEYFPHAREDRSIIRAPRRMGRRFRGL